MKKTVTKSAHFVVPLVVYPFDVLVSINQTNEELKAELDKWGIEWDVLLEMPTTALGRSVLLAGNQTVIRLRHFPKYPEDNGTLAHEIFHAVVFILNRLGIKLCRKSDEAYAYLIGHLTKEIYKRIK